MTPIRINIPDAKPPEWHAAGIVMAAFRRNGIDPTKAIHNPMCQSVALAWVRGEMDDAGFAKCCENLLIMNPSLGPEVRS